MQFKENTLNLKINFFFLYDKPLKLFSFKSKPLYTCQGTLSAGIATIGLRNCIRIRITSHSRFSDLFLFPHHLTTHWFKYAVVDSFPANSHCQFQPGSECGIVVAKTVCILIKRFCIFHVVVSCCILVRVGWLSSGLVVWIVRTLNDIWRFHHLSFNDNHIVQSQDFQHETKESPKSVEMATSEVNYVIVILKQPQWPNALGEKQPSVELKFCL